MPETKKDKKVIKVKKNGLEQLGEDVNVAVKAITIDPLVCTFCKGPRIEVTRCGIPMLRCLDCGVEISK